MSRQNFSYHLKLAIWYASNKKSGYLDTPIGYPEMEIDHIIPERVLYNPKEPDESEKWKKKYDLEDGFDILGIENLCPSTRDFNNMKSDNGLYDETDAYSKYIRKALIRAKQLKPKVEELSKKYKKELDLRNTKLIVKVQKAVESKKVDLKPLILSGNLKIDNDEIEHLVELGKYEKIFTKYRSEGINFYNFGEYFEIKKALRYSILEKQEDIEFWIALFDNFLKNTDDNKLKKKIFYEKAYIIFKAGISWIPIEIEILEYLKSMKDEINLEILYQSSILCNLFYREYNRNRIKSSIDTVFEIRDFILENLYKKIENSKTEGRIASLEYSKFLVKNLCFNRNEYEKIVQNKEDHFEKWIERYYQGLNQLIDIIENVRYFDFDEFYTTFMKHTEMIPLIRDYQEFDEILSRMMLLKNKYEGNNSTISDLMQRGIELFEKEDYYKTIKHFHKVKNISFNPAKIYDCIVSIYYIGESYHKLGLHYAAKYYYMVAFHLTNEMDIEYNIKQLSYLCGTDRIANIDFELNNTIEGIYFSLISFILRDFYSIFGFSLTNEDDQNVFTLVENILKIYAYSKQKSKDLINKIELLLKSYGFLEFIKEGTKALNLNFTKEDIKWIDENVEKLFRDLEMTRYYSWYQLNIDWTIKWENSYQNTMLSELFIAYLQIFLSTLNDIDILSTSEIEIEIKQPNEIHFNGENGKLFTLFLPLEKDSTYYHKLFALYTGLITQKIIMSKEQIMEEVNPLFTVGYFSNYYDEIYKTLIPREIFKLEE